MKMVRARDQPKKKKKKRKNKGETDIIIIVIIYIYELTFINELTSQLSYYKFLKEEDTLCPVRELILGTLSGKKNLFSANDS